MNHQKMDIKYKHQATGHHYIVIMAWMPRFMEDTQHGPRSMALKSQFTDTHLTSGSRG